MKKTTALSIFASLQILLLSSAFLAGYMVRAGADSHGGAWPVPGAHQQRPYPLLDEVRGLLEAHFIGPMPDGATLEYGAVRGLVSAVDDPYTVFVEPEHHELETNSLQGEYGGVGAEVRHNEDGEVVLSPYPDSPAAAAGVLDGDVLLAVDDAPLAAHVALDTVTALVRGPVGTTVRLTLRHTSDREETISVKRQRIELPSVTWHSLESEPAIGLITISRFSDKTPGEVERAIDELDAQGVHQYILDLRNNGGGILESAVDVAGHFLNAGVVMYETQRDAPERTYTAPAGGGPATEAPLVVLVNHNTASAAEIVAGALLDRGRAPLVGQPTFGKGSVQLVYDLSDGSSLHVTAYRWFTPARRELEESGLPPTYTVEPGTDGNDTQLTYAVDYLNSLAEGEQPELAQDDGR